MRFFTCTAITLMITMTAWAQAPDRLEVRGKDIVNSKGEVVSMRGINFGGWLMMETWIPSIEMEWHDHLPRLAKEAGIEAELKKAEKDLGEFKDDVESVGSYIGRLHTLLKTRVPAEKFERYLHLFETEPPQYAAADMDKTLRKRFGDYGAAEIWNTFHDTWLTEHDFQLARAFGFNFVRIPFWYRWFESDDNPGEYCDYGFRYLDKAVEWASNHGLYVMLDFHAVPGCQSPWDHTGEMSNARFFKDEGFQKRTFAIWKAVAAHYRDNPTVFAYDAVNEPFSAVDEGNWTAVHDGIYKAIREADPKTIIMMEEGYKLEQMPWKKTGFFPDPRKMGWENVVYSFHFYSGPDPELVAINAPANHDKCLKEVLRVGRMEQKRCNVPIYLGEFNTMGGKPEDIAGMKKMISAFNKEGWHWSPWTWKYVNDDNESTIWGVYQYKRPWPGTPNMHRDTKEYILDLISRLRTENFSIHEPYAGILRECLVQPVSSAAK